MVARPSIDVSGWLHEQLVQASPDLLRGVVKTFAEAGTQRDERGAQCSAIAVTDPNAANSASAAARMPNPTPPMDGLLTCDTASPLSAT